VDDASGVERGRGIVTADVAATEPTRDFPAASDSLAGLDADAAPGAREQSERESLEALESDATGRPAIVDSMRRAEIIARSTAARLYGTDRDGAGGLERREITDAARDEVSRNGGLKAPEVAVQRPAAKIEPEEPKAAIEAPNEAKPEPVVAEAPPVVEPPQPEPQAPPVVKSVAAAEVAAAPSKPAVVAAAATAPEQVKAAIAKAAEKEPKPAPAVAPAPEVAAASASPAPPPPGPFTLGRAVRVKDGDTVWDIALEHYGSAGSAVLKRILVNNPGVRDPLRLEVGSTVFLPFSRPEQMIRKESAGYRVVLVSGTSRERLEEVGRWASVAGGEVRITSTSSGAGPVLYEISVVGLPSESAALSMATNLFESSATGAPERTAMR
jgi:phage tail protein X